MTIHDDSPVRGMVPMRDYLKLLQENDDLRERLRDRADAGKPVLLAHEVGAGGTDRYRPRGPAYSAHYVAKAGSIAAQVVEHLRGAGAAGTGDIAKALGVKVGTMATRLKELADQDVVQRSGKTGRGHPAVWRLHPRASQPKE